MSDTNSFTMRRPLQPFVVLHLRINVELARRLRDRSIAESETASAVVRRALVEYLDRVEQKRGGR